MEWQFTPNPQIPLPMNMLKIRMAALLLTLAVLAADAAAGEYHVALTGSDANPGTQKAPFRTIQHASDLAQPGDTITVHAGVYRERVNPPRGGRRIKNASLIRPRLARKWSSPVRKLRSLGAGHQ